MARRIASPTRRGSRWRTAARIGHPYPVPIKVYDQTIQVLKSAVEKARLGRDEELAVLKRLDDQARRLERQATGPGVAELIAREREDSHAYGGRSVFGWEPPPGQLRSG
jgi:uncharacterized protein